MCVTRPRLVNAIFFLTGQTFIVFVSAGIWRAAVVSSSRQTQHVYKWDHNTSGVFVEGFFGPGLTSTGNQDDIMTLKPFHITSILWGESTSVRWVSLIKGQLCVALILWRVWIRKCHHEITTEYNTTKNTSKCIKMCTIFGINCKTLCWRMLQFRNSCGSNCYIFFVTNY